MPNLTIDGRQASVPEGSTVIQAAERLGLFIPRYCYHPGLPVAGNCRICLVEVEKFPKLQIACNLRATEGMVVHTKSANAEKGRRAVLEFLLANHPLDCPVCDQSGECDLQNFYMNFGLYDPRFRERKVKKKKAVKLGPHVMLDQERCILCSRCVRFTDEITKTGEFGIFNRGDRAELGLCPGETLDNPYSANVVDICPVGALTEVDSRFKARVWYLSSAPTVCNGCSQGCNIDVHFVLDRPHLNEGARVVRVKPRHNPEVNQWWMCDEGRYGFDWVDRNRLTAVRGPSGERSWDQALTAIATALTAPKEGNQGQPGRRLGVIASAQLSNEELFLIHQIFENTLGARVSAAVPGRPGSQDDFLIKADKNPNTSGARLIGLNGDQPPDAASIVDGAAAGELDLLWVFGHDLVALFGEEKTRRISEAVPTIVFCGSNQNATVDYAHWVLPAAAYLEKEGTFVNGTGRVQLAPRAFPPLGDSREEWRVLLDLADRLGLRLRWRQPSEIFDGLAGFLEPFRGLSHTAIGAQGIQLAASLGGGGVHD